jgi:hypothetical protein
MSNVVNIERFKEKNFKEIEEFIGEDKFVVVKFTEEESVEMMSNFHPGMLECTLLHAAYLFLISATND